VLRPNSLLSLWARLPELAEPLGLCQLPSSYFPGDPSTPVALSNSLWD
jgi:hypothetical protein